MMDFKHLSRERSLHSSNVILKGGLPTNVLEYYHSSLNEQWFLMVLSLPCLSYNLLSELKSLNCAFAKTATKSFYKLLKN